MFVPYRTKECMLASALYATYSVMSIGFDEMFPVFSATETRYSKTGYFIKL